MARQRGCAAIGTNTAAIQRPAIAGACDAYDRAHVTEPAARQHSIVTVSFQRDLEGTLLALALADRLGQRDAQAAQIRFDAHAGLAVAAAGIAVELGCKTPLRRAADFDRRRQERLDLRGGRRAGRAQRGRVVALRPDDHFDGTTEPLRTQVSSGDQRVAHGQTAIQRTHRRIDAAHRHARIGEARSHFDLAVVETLDR